MDYISAEKKDVICKKIKANCCNSVLYTSKAKKRDYDEVTMHMPDTYSKSLCSFTGDQKNAISACKQSCNLNDKCKGVIYNKTMERCDIYDKPLITKPGFLQNDTDAETAQFQRVEGFQDSNKNNNRPKNNSVNSNTGPSGAAEYCYNDGMGDQTGEGTCYKKNAIVTDCRNQFDKCMTRDIPGLSPTKKKEHCSTIYGSCCSIVDGLNVVERFKFLDAEVGGGNPANRLCSWKTSSLDDCKKKCFEDPGCNYIYSNLGIKESAMQDGSKNCQLYSGAPVAGGIPSFAKGGAVGKFIYKKVEVNPDDELNEPETTIPSTTTQSI
jgi:hypothetical protein